MRKGRTCLYSIQDYFTFLFLKILSNYYLYSSCNWILKWISLKIASSDLRDSKTRNTTQSPRLLPRSQVFDEKPNSQISKGQCHADLPTPAVYYRSQVNVVSRFPQDSTLPSPPDSKIHHYPHLSLSIPSGNRYNSTLFNDNLSATKH